MPVYLLGTCIISIPILKVNGGKLFLITLTRKQYSKELIKCNVKESYMYNVFRFAMECLTVYMT